MRRFSEGMIVSNYHDSQLYIITKITDEDVFYKSLNHGNWETREDKDFFSSLAPEGFTQKYRWRIVR